MGYVSSRLGQRASQLGRRASQLGQLWSYSSIARAISLLSRNNLAMTSLHFASRLLPISHELARSMHRVQVSFTFRFHNRRATSRTISRDARATDVVNRFGLVKSTHLCDKPRAEAPKEVHSGRNVSPKDKRLPSLRTRQQRRIVQKCIGARRVYLMRSQHQRSRDARSRRARTATRDALQAHAAPYMY